MKPIHLKTFRAQRIRAAPASRPAGVVAHPAINALLVATVAGGNGGPPYLYLCNAMQDSIDRFAVDSTRW